jgi:hypothetical protein
LLSSISKLTGVDDCGGFNRRACRSSTKYITINSSSNSSMSAQHLQQRQRYQRMQ